MVTWGELIAGAEERVGPADARRIAERASGYPMAELVLHRGETVSPRVTGFFDDMVARRTTGEPLQYVLGQWSFRTLELRVDRRVLIPRPETEVVVDIALTEVQALALDHPPVVADLG